MKSMKIRTFADAQAWREGAVQVARGYTKHAHGRTLSWSGCISHYYHATSQHILEMRVAKGKMMDHSSREKSSG